MSLAGTYNSNIFGNTSGEVSDVLFRPRLGLGLGYFSDRLTMVGTYARDGEFYADRSDLNNSFEGQLAGLDARFAVTPRLRGEVNASYRESFGTWDVPPETGLRAVDVGLQQVKALDLRATLAYAVTPRLTAEGGYRFTHSEVVGTSTEEAHEASVGVAWLFTPLDRGTLRYRAALFSSNVADDVTSHAVLVGWGRRLDPSTSVTVEAGPVFIGSDVDAAALLRLDHSFSIGTISLGLSRDQTVVVGLSGARTAQTLSAATVFDRLGPVRIRLEGNASLIDHVRGSQGRDTQLYGSRAEASYAITTWLFARANYDFFYERDGDSVTRHIVTLALDFIYPIHVGR
jgi:hypothetical protein